MKKLIVTGGSGFIGSYIVKNALSENFKVLNLDKLTYASIKNNIKDKNYTFKKFDICSNKIKQIIKNFQPDYIINCAAETHVDRSIDDPSEFIRSNIYGVFNLLEAIKNKKIKFLQISTDEVFGSLKINKEKFNEKTSYDPKSPYSASKAASDHLVRSYGNTYDLNYLITNCSNNYGPLQYPEKFIPMVIKSCIKKETIPIYGNGLNIRDWIHADDHAKAVLKCLTTKYKKETFLIGANCEKTNIDIVNIICNKFKRKYGDSNFNYLDLKRFVTDRKGHDLRYAINPKKIQKMLRWKAKINFDKGIDETIEYYIKNFSSINKVFKKDKWLKGKY